MQGVRRALFHLVLTYGLLYTQTHAPDAACKHSFHQYVSNCGAMNTSRRRFLTPTAIEHMLAAMSPSVSEDEELPDSEDELIPNVNQQQCESTSSESDDDIEETRPSNSSPDIDENILDTPVIATDTVGT